MNQEQQTLYRNILMTARPLNQGFMPRVGDYLVFYDHDKIAYLGHNTCRNDSFVRLLRVKKVTETSVYTHTPPQTAEPYFRYRTNSWMRQRPTLENLAMDASVQPTAIIYEQDLSNVIGIEAPRYTYFWEFPQQIQCSQCDKPTVVYHHHPDTMARGKCDDCHYKVRPE